MLLGFIRSLFMSGDACVWIMVSYLDCVTGVRVMFGY